MSAAAPEAASAPAQVATDTPAVQETEPGFKVFAGNLAYATTDEGLKAFFAPVADDILSVQVIQRGTRSAGYGFVTLSTTAAVEKAVAALNGKELDTRAIIVEGAKPAEDKEKDRAEKRAKKAARTSRRGNKAVTGEVTEAEANGEEASPAAAGAEGDADKPARAKKARKPRVKKPKAEGEVAEGGDAAASGEAGEKKPKKAPRAPRKPREPGQEPEGAPSKSVLFVANLAFNVDDEVLGNLFKDAGISVVSARVVRRRFGQPRRSKGYGFVDVGDEENQKKALESFNGKELEGREIAVKIAVSAPTEEELNGEEKPAGEAPAVVAA